MPDFDHQQQQNGGPDVAHLADEASRKTAEQSQRIAEATASVNERAARASVELVQHGTEAMQDALNSGTQLAATLAERSADQFSKALGLTGDGAEKAAEQTNENMDAIVESGAMITELTQSATKEWLQFTNETLEKNLDQVGRLMQCRSPQEFVSLQSQLVRSNLERWLHCTRRVAETSGRVAERATQKIGERARRAA